jgi:putative peptidoglycan lipid II flippase
MSISKSLLKSTSIVSAMTMLSRVLGFARDMLMASLFGTAAGFDAFLVAFKIPNFMRGLFAEGSFSQAFVPVLAEYRQSRSESEVKQFIGRTMGFLGVALLMVTLVAEIITPLLVITFAPGFLHDPMRYQMATHMLRITFPYLMLISMTAFFGAVLNSYGAFWVPSFTPVLLNVAMIVAAIYLAPLFGVPETALAWGVLLAGVSQLLFQIPFLQRTGLLPRPQWGWQDEGVRRVLRLMVPALFGVSVAQIGLLIDTLFASFLPEGSISWLYYSERLTFFPLGVFGVALATVVLPHFSRQHANNSHAEFVASLDWALRCLLVISLPATVGLFLMSGPLVASLFQYGHFNAHDVVMTQKSVIAFAIGLPGFMAVKVLASAFYSRQDIRSPVRIAIVATMANMVLNLLFIVPLAHTGLALATSISSGLNALLLYFTLMRFGIYKPLAGWRKYLLQLLSANAVMAAVLWLGPAGTQQWIQWDWHVRAGYLSFWIGAAAAVYFVCLWLVGVRLHHFKVQASVHRTFSEADLSPVKIQKQ